MSLVMVHEGVDATAEVVSLEVFAKVWEPRGWEILDKPCAFASRVLGKKVTALDSLSAADLDRLARSRRVQRNRATKAENVQTFLDTFSNAAAKEPAVRTPSPNLDPENSGPESTESPEAPPAEDK